MKTKNKRNYLKESGITLIALVVTIVVLLILAGVSINALFGNSGIIKKAQNAQNTMKKAEENDKISVILTEWEIKKATKETTFEKFMKEKFGEGNVTVVTEDEVIVTMESGNQYQVKTDGTITSKVLTINKSSLTLRLQEEIIVTETLTASLSGITGEITWSISDNTKATISSTKGESITVTGLAVGETIITATCGDYTATCKVNVKEAIAIGGYVEYDVPYIDMYSNIEYTKTTGWRYLGKDDAGNKLIVSTGIPAILDYTYNFNIGNVEDGGANSWWATKAEISATTDTLYQTIKGYNYVSKREPEYATTDDPDGQPSKYAAYGMRYKFDKIPFGYQASGIIAGANTGIFRKVGNTTSGENISLNFKADGVNVVDVHNLTLAELNRATNKASGTTRSDTAEASGFKDLTGTALGLFDMQDLTNYTQTYYYWLATPTGSERVFLVRADIDDIDSNFFGSYGIRPVITLPSNVNLTVVE